MKILVAPNALKGSLSAHAAAAAMAQGVARACRELEIVQIPVADGGDGLVEVLMEALGGERRQVVVSGPRGEPVSAGFCHVPGRRLAVIEMAAASGLALLAPERRDPLRTSTRGTGELIRAALDLGIEHLIIGLGGSATHEGGIGMASALGAAFLDAWGRPVAPVGGALTTIQRIDLGGLDARLARLRVEALCDVDNPLLGERGAARVYAPQKGATPEQVPILEAGLAHLADRIERDLGLEVRHLPGAGAAGGLGAGLGAFLGAELRPGVDLVLDLVGLDEQLRGAALVLTAEGWLDRQTAFGKAPAGVARRARAQGVTCIALAGGLDRDDLAALHELGMGAAFSLCPGPVSLDQAMERAAEYLAHATEQATRAFLAGYLSGGKRVES